jgi:translation initiation factor 2 gamma subunit (eIF-2gamma)
VTKADALAGRVVSLLGKLPEETRVVEIETKLFEEVVGAEKKVRVEPLKMNETLLFSINTSIVLGEVRGIRNSKTKIELRSPVVAFSKSRVGIARNIEGHWRLVGYGIVL